MRPGLRSRRSSYGGGFGYSRPMFSLKAKFAAVAVAGIAVVGGIAIAPGYFKDSQLQVTVTDKQRVTTGSGDNIESKYLIYTDKEVFEDTDSLAKGKFNSSDLYAYLKPGCTFDIKAYGIRSQFNSMYRNITKANWVKTEQCPVEPPRPH